MKILWFASLLPTPFRKGVAPWNVKNIEALRLWGDAEVKAVCPIRLIPPEALIFRFPPEIIKLDQWYKARQNTPSNMQYEDIDITYLKWHGLPKRLFWGIEGRIMYSQLRKPLAKIVNDFRPDVIHVPWLNPEGVTGCLLGEEFSIPCVVQAQGSDVNYYLRQYPWRKIFIQDIQKAAALSFVCQALKNSAANLGLTHRNSQVIYNGVDIDTFKPANDLHSGKFKKIVTVAGLKPVKNLSLLLNAFNKLPLELKNSTELVVVGDGPCRQKLKKQTKELNIQSRVHFVGQVTHVNVAVYLKQSDLFCLTSLSEGLPVAAIEAMACGLPIVATKVGGVPEVVVEGGTGILVESNNVDAYVNALQIALLKQWDPVSIREVVQSKFTWQRYAENMMSLYRSLC